MGSNEENIREEVFTVLNGWKTCSAEKKKEVFGHFFEFVEEKLVKDFYSDVEGVNKDLEIVKNFLAKSEAEDKNYTKRSYRCNVKFDRAKCGLLEVELYMRIFLESGEDIGEDDKKWIKKHCRDIDSIRENLNQIKRSIEDGVCSLENMGCKVPKPKKFEREEVGEEDYKLIEYENTKCMWRKREEYMFWKQEIDNLLIKCEEVFEPYSGCGSKFPSYFYKKNVKKIVRCLEEKDKHYKSI